MCADAGTLADVTERSTTVTMARKEVGKCFVDLPLAPSLVRRGGIRQRVSVVSICGSPQRPDGERALEKNAGRRPDRRFAGYGIGVGMMRWQAALALTIASRPISLIA